MATAIAPGAHPEFVMRLIPGGAPSLARLTDDELLANTRRLVGKTNQLPAALLLHLAEVETRGAHRTRCCASLYTYCIYELRFSEDAAARRSAAARFVKQFPALLDAVAAGELHLTGLLMIGPHLTPENHVNVLARAKFRTKKELAKLVRDLNPLPSLADCVEPLGPQPAASKRKPTWAEFVEWRCFTGRDLPEGERPRDWVGDDNDGGGEGGRQSRRGDGLDGESAGEAGGGTHDADETALPVGPIPSDLPPITTPQQYGLQFSTVEEHVRLIEKAKDLLARERPGITLGELHLEAMKVLVASLDKRKFAVTQKARAPRQRGGAAADTDPSEPPRQRGASECGRASSEKSRSLSRHVPAAVRREVYERDDGRCAHVDARGERCREKRFLEIHHLEAFAKGGVHRASNLALRCAAHNALAAEEDFGKSRVAERRDPARHESLARQLASNRFER